jgi:WD40 repeat protein
MNGPISAAAFSPDGTILAAALARFLGNNTSQSQVVLYDIPREKVLKMLPGKRPYVRTLVFSDGGKKLVLAGVGTVSWWDLEIGKERRTWKPFADEKQPAKGGGMKTKIFDSCALSPDARSIAVRVAWTYDPTAQPRPYNPDATDHEAFGLDLATHKILWRVTARYNDQHNSHFAYSADGKRVAITMGPDRMEVRDAITGKLVATPLERMFGGFYTRGSVALSSDGRTAAVASDNASVLLWNPGSDDKPRRLVPRNLAYAADCLQFSPDNKTLLVNVGGDLELYDVATLQEKLPWHGHRTMIDFVAFTQDGKRLLTGSGAESMQPQELAAWETASWTHQQRTAVHTAPRPNIGSVSPDQSVYLGKSGDDRFALFEMSSGNLLARFDLVPKLPGGARGFFSPTGKFYLLDCLDEKGKAALALYTLPSGKRLCLLPPLPMSFRDSGRPVAFTANGRLVAVVSLVDGKIHVCDTETGKVRQRLGPAGILGQIPRNYLTGNLAFSPDGNYLASWTTMDNAIRLWDVATGAEAQRLAAEEPGGQPRPFPYGEPPGPHRLGA